MIDELFVLGLGVVLFLILRWGFHALPDEQWQIMACRPRLKHRSGEWTGENLTFYGLFNANAYVMGVAVLFILLGAAAIPLRASLILVTTLLLICMPASRIVARVVEKKKHTFTIGGAAFVGILIGPWMIGLTDALLGPRLRFEMPVLPVMAAFCVAYAFGEGIGRLACISFGCCYGKPLSKCPPLFQRWFEKHSFVFSGATKKISYADHLDGEKIIPVQGMTAVLYCFTGLLGVYLFLKGFYFTAFFQSLAVTQLWRALSEFFRADYRGEGRISAYQIMAILAIGYGLILAFIFPVAQLPQARLLAGLKSLWHPGMILFLQALWVASFLYTGRSKVTGSSISLHVMKNRI